MKMYEEIGTFAPDNLIAGENVPIQLNGITILAGQGVLKRGSVIGIITASGKGKHVAKASVDGSEIAKFILADDVDTTADVVAQCYQSGLFNREALIFPAANTAADHEDSLRQYGIFLKDNIAY
ncbi:MAG: bacteriophage lambda head decoration protein [Clostridia bacterium]|jgi:hypothetical protein|nr:bacteriophage lambda head decoration protein [Clostridia bacterium]